MPYFKPTTTFVPQEAKSEEPKEKSNIKELDNLNINDEFTPSTPYVHKFRTEMCRNWELTGTCKYGDEVSTI